MGILRIKSRVEELLERDPYELFTLEEQARPEAHLIVRGLRPQFWAAAALALAFTFIIAGVTYWNLRDSRDVGGDRPFAYFEVRAIDINGRPVAGASVRQGSEALGVTDSFGEWRRFMRVKLGDTVAIQLSKATTKGQLAAVKNLAIPGALPKDGELEITGRVQMLEAPTDAGVPLAREMAVQAVESPATPVTPRSVAFVIDGIATPALNAVVDAMQKRSRELGLATDPASPWQVVLKTHAIAGVQATGSNASLLSNDLIQVSSIDRAQGRGRPTLQYSFLRNYQESGPATARHLLWLLTQHARMPQEVVRRGGEWLVTPQTVALWQAHVGDRLIASDGSGALFDLSLTADGSALRVNGVAPCGTATQCQMRVAGHLDQAPKLGWTKIPLKVVGELTPDTQVFVSGYQMLHGAQGTQGTQGAAFYWGLPDSEANVTVIRAGRVIARTRIAPRNQVATLHLPSAPVSSL